MTDVPEKVRSYEEFVNERLRVDLRNLLQQRDALFAEEAAYLELRGMVERQQVQQEKVLPLTTMVNLGQGCLMRARVKQPERLFVDVGFGLHAELTPSETLKFVDAKVELLRERAKLLTTQACDVRARIRLVLEGLRELEGLKQDQPSLPHHRDIFS